MKSKTSIVKSVYRADIDGLRAIAVLSVVLYHAGFSAFSGGFVGVDVFFVISGYLITRLLLNEVNSNNTIDFARFYLRRTRRLLPAMFFTLFCSTALAIWLLSPLSLENYGASLLHSVLSVSNLYFYSQSGYFDTGSSLKPLLHTWSLGVEEQFYMFWPFLVGLIAPRKLGLPLLIMFLAVISFYFSITLIDAHADAVFFLTPLRIFEFSFGSILVWLVPKDPKTSNSGWINDILLLIGITLIMYSVFAYNKQTQFPGFSALLPCAGAAICIFAGKANRAGRLLNNKLFVNIGLISYSLYLAHWPLIVFYKKFTNTVTLSYLESTLLVVISMVIAVFMYFFIEKPFRKTQSSNNRYLLTCGLLMVLMSYIGASMWANEGWSWRSWASGGLSVEATQIGKDNRFKILKEICAVKGWVTCNDSVDGKINGLIIGDSHAVDALNSFHVLYPEHNLSMSQLGGCPPHQNIEAITQPNHPDRIQCKELNKKRYTPEYLKSFDYIVINVLFGWYTPDHLRQYLAFLNANEVKNVIVFGDYLELQRDMYEIVSDYGFDATQVNREVNKRPDIEKLLKRNVESFDYLFVSKRKVFCQSGECEFFDAMGVPFTYDKHHLSYEFAVKVGVYSKAEIDRYIRESRTVSSTKNATGYLVVSNWAPRSASVGKIPNIQPNGGMGLWIKASLPEGFGEADVLFDGHPALITNVSVAEQLITSSISPTLFSHVGESEVVIKQRSSGKLFPIGVFKVAEASK